MSLLGKGEIRLKMLKMLLKMMTNPNKNNQIFNKDYKAQPKRFLFNQQD